MTSESSRATSGSRRSGSRRSESRRATSGSRRSGSRRVTSSSHRATSVSRRVTEDAAEATSSITTTTTSFSSFSTPPADEGWNCSRCTLWNLLAVSRCIACDGRRPVQVTEFTSIHTAAAALEEHTGTESPCHGAPPSMEKLGRESLLLPAIPPSRPTPDALSLPKSAMPPQVFVLEPGTRVLARFMRRTRWYPGVVRQINEDGTVCIDYDDGDVEMAVKRQHIKLPKNAPAPSAAASATPSLAPQPTPLREAGAAVNTSSTAVRTAEASAPGAASCAPSSESILRPLQPLAPPSLSSRLPAEACGAVADSTSAPTATAGMDAKDMVMEPLSTGVVAEAAEAAEAAAEAAAEEQRRQSLMRSLERKRGRPKMHKGESAALNPAEAIAMMHNSAAREIGRPPGAWEQPMEGQHDDGERDELPPEAAPPAAEAAPPAAEAAPPAAGRLADRSPTNDEEVRPLGPNLPYSDPDPDTSAAVVLPQHCEP